MDLNTVWFGLIVVLFVGYFFLEGFDYGVGMLVPVLGRQDAERRVLLNTVGPHWDGNEVWLLTAGGAMFAAFPHWYATLFSGFYLALVLMLLALILRGVAFEFRSKSEGRSWRTMWDWAVFAGSLLPALLWGIAIGNLMRGVPIDGNMQYTGTFWDLLNPFALLGGLAFVLLFLFHGATFLGLKTEAEVREKARRASTLLWVPAVAAVALFVIAGAFTTDLFSRAGGIPAVLVLVAAVALIADGWFIRIKRERVAFAMTGATIALATVAIFVGLFPRVMISSLDPVWNLTIYNASSTSYTLTVMTVVAAVFVPVVLFYQAWSYWIFRRRVTRAQTLEY